MGRLLQLQRSFLTFGERVQYDCIQYLRYPQTTVVQNYSYRSNIVTFFSGATLVRKIAGRNQNGARHFLVSRAWTKLLTQHWKVVLYKMKSCEAHINGFIPTYLVFPWIKLIKIRVLGYFKFLQYRYEYEQLVRLGRLGVCFYLSTCAITVIHTLKKYL